MLQVMQFHQLVKQLIQAALVRRQPFNCKHLSNCNYNILQICENCIRKLFKTDQLLHHMNTVTCSVLCSQTYKETHKYRADHYIKMAA